MHNPNNKPWACYTNGCREPACRDGWRIYRRDLERQKRRPDGKLPPALIDVSESRKHLRWLSSRGVGVTQISRVTGISRSTLQVIRSGRTKKIHPHVANKILGVHLGRVKPSNHTADRWPNAGDWAKLS